MRRVIGLVSLAFVVLLAVAPAAHAQAPKEIVIGVIYPMTGNLAQLGIDSVTALRMAADQYNGKSELNLPSMKKSTDGLPGLGGAKIRLVVADHQGKPDVGQAEAERMITQEKVSALLLESQNRITEPRSQPCQLRRGLHLENLIAPGQPR